MTLPPYLARVLVDPLIPALLVLTGVAFLVSPGAWTLAGLAVVGAAYEHRRYRARDDLAARVKELEAKVARMFNRG